MARNRSEKFVENTTEKDELNAKIAALENRVSNLQYELNKKVIMLHFDPYFWNSTYLRILLYDMNKPVCKEKLLDLSFF
jgi:hypothetical protein